MAENGTQRVSAVARIEALEQAVAELGDRLQGIHTPERFRALMPAVAPYVETFRSEQAATRAAQAAARPKVTVSRERYKPVTSESWHP